MMLRRLWLATWAVTAAGIRMDGAAKTDHGHSAASNSAPPKTPMVFGFEENSPVRIIDDEYKGRIGIIMDVDESSAI